MIHRRLFKQLKRFSDIFKIRKYTRRITPSKSRMIIRSSKILGSDNKFVRKSASKVTKLPLGNPKRAKGKPSGFRSIYLVRKGDTLSGIGRRFGVPFQVLATFNRIKNPNFIRAGQRIAIPRKGKLG